MTHGTSPAQAFHPKRFSEGDYAQLLEVIEACDVGLCLVDGDLNVLAWNRRLSEMTGNRSTEVLGRQIGAVLPSLADAHFVNRVRALLQNDGDAAEATTLELSQVRHLYRDPEKGFRSVSVRPLVMHPGHCLVQISDVASQIAFHEQARDTVVAEQRTLAMLSSIDDAVILLDAKGCIEFANMAAEGMTGFPLKEMAGRPLDETYQVFDELSETREFLDYERIVSQHSRPLVMMHREGLTFPIEQSITRLKDRQGGNEGLVLVFKDISQSRKLAAQLNWQASHDPVTRLYNRAEFDRRLTQLLEEAEVEGSQHGLLYLDIDRFKVVNDTCGHVAGDELLRQVASLIRQAIRSSDLLARLGGDEFGILLSNCNLEAARRIADAIRLEFQRFRFAWSDKTFSQSVSIGVVSISKQSEGLQQVLSLADSACFAAKEAGRNRVHVYHPERGVAALRHGEVQWVTRIRSALEEDRFALYVQPIQALGGTPPGRRHHEVLIRMLDETGNLIPPGAFIPAAERYDLMPAIDRWVVKRLVRCINDHWGDRVREEGRLFVNLSGQSLCDEETLQVIVELLREHRAVDGLLSFEVTETAAISNLSSAKRFMQTLKCFGCEFALDDFGSGLSSFGYLKHLPVEYLKIDGCFVKDMGRDPIDESMVDAINRIGHIMGLETIAECVESDEILRQLSEMGVDYVQGFGLVKPFPIDDFWA